MKYLIDYRLYRIEQLLDRARRQNGGGGAWAGQDKPGSHGFRVLSFSAVTFRCSLLYAECKFVQCKKCVRRRAGLRTACVTPSTR